MELKSIWKVLSHILTVCMTDHSVCVRQNKKQVKHLVATQRKIILKIDNIYCKQDNIIKKNRLALFIEV